MQHFQLQTVDNRLSGRLALVTGASGGIGSACARTLAAEGCDVALHYSSNINGAQSLAEELRTKHPLQRFTPVKADLRNREASRNLVLQALQHDDIASRHKAVSVLVANAGLGRRIRDVAEIHEQDWDEMMEVNARSQFVVAKACLEGMRHQSWGRIVLVSSIASNGGGLNGCHYAASKGAISSMGRNLATLLAPEGVTVNIVSPAMISSTGMMPAPKSRIWTSEDDLIKLKETDPGLAVATGVPVRRLGCPEEVAHVVLLFAKTGYMTGQDVQLSGGLK